jgi:transporter family protein
MAVFFALLAFIGWGVGDVLIAVVARKIGNLTTLFWGITFSLIATSFYIPFAGEMKDWGMFVFALLLGLVDFAGSLAYFRALEKGNVSLVGTAAASFGMVTTIMSVVVFGESIKFIQGIGMSLTFIGIILVSLNFRELKNKELGKIISDKSILLALFAAVAWGTYFTFVRIPVEKIGWFWANYPLNFFFIFFLLTRGVRKNLSKIFINKKTLLTVFIYTVLVNMAMFGYNLGITYGNNSLVAPITGSYIILYVLLAGYIFREPLTIQQKTGMVSSVIGIVLISLS